MLVSDWNMRKKIFICINSMKQDNDNCVKFTLTIVKQVQLKPKIFTTVCNIGKCLSPCPGPHPAPLAPLVCSHHAARCGIGLQAGTCGIPQGVGNSSISIESQIISFSLVTLTQESYHSSPICHGAEGTGICKARYRF